MNLEEYRTLFIVVTLGLILLVATPTLSMVTPIQSGSEQFSELWLLGPTHKVADYPFSITRDYNYSMYLGIGNHLGYCAYYLVEVKFRNQTQSAPNGFNSTPSCLPALFNITAFVADEGIWELPLTFSFDYRHNETLSQVEFYSLTLNDVALDMENYTVAWDHKSNGFFGNLFFELWIYDMASHVFQYHGRFVGIWLNFQVS